MLDLTNHPKKARVSLPSRKKYEETPIIYSKTTFYATLVSLILVFLTQITKPQYILLLASVVCVV